MGQTLTEKIIARASGLQSVSPGEIVAYCRIRTFCKKYGMVGFRLLDTFDQRKKVLIFNYHAIKNDLSLEFSDYNDMNEYNYFICKDRKKRFEMNIV